MHTSYQFELNNSLPDPYLSTDHFFIDIVLGNSLITALKDEGASNSFITKGLVDACDLERSMTSDVRGSERFTNADGGLMDLIGSIKNVSLQIGDIDYKLDVIYVTPEPHRFFIIGADVFHEDRIYKIGQNDKEKIMEFAYE